MPLDREATLRQAEKFLRQGKLDGAIAEYVRLLDDQPRDWNAINALGDLYVRAGDAERAVARFTQVADYLYGEGFLPKAQALYKKALKVKGDHEHTLVRLSEIALQQGLLADARVYLRQLGRQRRDRGDSRGAAECLVRLASLDEADAETKLAGAQGAQSLGDTAAAKTFLTDAADALEKAGRTAEATQALADAAALDPADVGLRSRLAREYVAAGELDKARAFLTRETAGSDPNLLLALGRRELTAGSEAEARSILTRLLAVAPERWGSLLALSEELAGAGSIDAAYLCVEIVAEDAVLAGDWDRGIDALRRFVSRGAHIPALAKLIDLAVDGGRDGLMADVQPQLADAYLAAGRGTEARVIAEDLVSREPESDAHVDRLRRALAMLGVEDVEPVIARLREPEPDLADVLDLSVPDVALSSPVELEPHVPLAAAPEAQAAAPAVASQEPPPVAPVETPVRASEDGAILLPAVEIDLTDALSGIGVVSPVLPPPPVPPTEEPVAPPPALESVFEEMRSRTTGDQRTAAEQYERALQHLEQGRLSEGIADLQGAARAPLFRFRAASRLGRLHVARDETTLGIEWLERAAEAPPPTAEEGRSIRYDLASALEQTGETARALAVFMELEAGGANYRDVRGRIEQLTRAQAGSPGR